MALGLLGLVWIFVCCGAGTRSEEDADAVALVWLF